MDALNLDAHSVPQLLAGLIILFALHFIWKVIEFFIEAYKEKNKKTDEGLKELELDLKEKIEQLTTLMSSYMETTIRLSDKLENAEKRLNELMKVDSKLRRLNSAIKLIAGNDWPRIKKELTDDEII